MEVRGVEQVVDGDLGRQAGDEPVRHGPVRHQVPVDPVVGVGVHAGILARRLGPHPVGPQAKVQLFEVRGLAAEPQGVGGNVADAHQLLAFPAVRVGEGIVGPQRIAARLVGKLAGQARHEE